MAKYMMFEQQSPRGTVAIQKDIYRTPEIPETKTSEKGSAFGLAIYLIGLFITIISSLTFSVLSLLAVYDVIDSDYTKLFVILDLVSIILIFIVAKAPTWIKGTTKAKAASRNSGSKNSAELGANNMNMKQFPSFGEWLIQQEKEKGILVFLDKGSKFDKTQHSLAILTDDCDIKVDSQLVDGEYRWLLIEVSPKGSLDRETYERDPDAPVCCVKSPYDTTHPDTLFNTTKYHMTLMKALIREHNGKPSKTYTVKDGLLSSEITEEEYNDPNYVF